MWRLRLRGMMLGRDSGGESTVCQLVGHIKGSRVKVCIYLSAMVVWICTDGLGVFPRRLVFNVTSLMQRECIPLHAVNPIYLPLPSTYQSPSLAAPSSSMYTSLRLYRFIPRLDQHLIDSHVLRLLERIDDSASHILRIQHLRTTRLSIRLERFLIGRHA